MANKRRDASSQSVVPEHSGSLPHIVSSPSKPLANPVSADEFAQLLAPLLPDSTTSVAIAVSGGADSMALVLLAHQWAQQAGRHLVVMTVDHGLRPESGAEAEQVERWLKQLGVRHVVLGVEGGKPTSNVQAWAREQRYMLMSEYCAAHDITALFLAHHLDDQAETLLLRLARGSGVDGLSAMAPVMAPAFEGAPYLLRPLLDVPRERLLATLSGQQQAWIEDPSNQDQKYARSRVRQARGTLESLGLTNDRLAQTALKMRRAKAALDADVSGLAGASVDLSKDGYATLKLASFSMGVEEVQLRLLSRLLRAVGGKAYAPREGRLKALLDDMLKADIGGGRTLSGCRLVPDSAGEQYLLCRETRGIEGQKPLHPDTPVYWDGRYRLGANTGMVEDGLLVGRLGTDGLRTIRETAEADLLQSLPRLVQSNLPALWRKGEVVAVLVSDQANTMVCWENLAVRRYRLQVNQHPRR